MPQRIVAPSLLSADFSKLNDQVQLVTDAGAQWLHFDVMDGHFVPNLTMGPSLLKSLRPHSSLVFDVHLMVTDPEKWIEPFAKAGADYITFHVEATKDPGALIKKIRAFNKRPGITLRPSTPLSAIEPFVGQVDLILIMTVEPGFSGQSFMPEPAKRLTTLRAQIGKNNGSTLLEVDGGVSLETASQVKDADVFVAGSFVFQNDPHVAIRSLKEALKVSYE